MCCSPSVGVWIWIKWPQHRGNPIATGVSWSTCSSAEHLPWTRLNQILATDPQTGITMLCESGQPDRHAPCWACYWQHHLSSRIDSSWHRLQLQSQLYWKCVDLHSSNEAEWNRFFTTFFFFQQCRKLREASGKPAVLNLKKKRTVHAIKMRGGYAAFMCTLAFQLVVHPFCCWMKLDNT